MKESFLYSKKVPVIGHYDVLISGGGPAGFVAAIAAARSGAKTALVEKCGYLGGAATASLVNPISTFKKNGVRVVSGIPWEFVQRLKEIGGAIDDYENGNVPFDGEKYKLIAQRMVLEAGVDLYLHSTVTDVIFSKKRLSRVLIANKSGLCALDTSFAVDCTGDGDLWSFCGLPFQSLPEGETYQPASLGFRIGGAKLDQVTGIYPRTPGAKFQMYSVREIFESLIGKERIPNFGGPWFCTVLLDEGGILSVNITRKEADGTDLYDVTQSECSLREDAFRLFALLKQYVPAFSDSYLIYSAPQVGYRETRRILGDHVLTAEEYASSVSFKDTVALGAHPIDVHRSGDSGQDVTFLSRPGYVPYRSLVSSEAENVLAAGRCISVDRKALGSVRVQATAMALGQAAGTAAALCLENGCSASDLDALLLREKLLKDGACLAWNEKERGRGI